MRVGKLKKETHTHTHKASLHTFIIHFVHFSFYIKYWGWLSSKCSVKGGRSSTNEARQRWKRPLSAVTLDVCFAWRQITQNHPREQGKKESFDVWKSLSLFYGTNSKHIIWEMKPSCDRIIFISLYFCRLCDYSAQDKLFFILLRLQGHSWGRNAGQNRTSCLDFLSLASVWQEHRVTLPNTES